MKKVMVLGPGCPKCVQLMQQTERAVMELKLDCSVEKITDIQEISSHGVMMTPALVVDGQVKMSGRVPSLEDLKLMLMQDKQS